jgi:TonB-linked SusC/RagA family outer membrane protein
MKKKLPNPVSLSESGIKKLLLTMKLALLIVFLSVLQVSANVYSQINVNLNVQDKSIREVLKALEQQSQVRFFYSDDLLVLNERIDIKADDKNIISVLDDIFSKSPLTYKAYDNNLIVIAPRELIQQQKVTGTVTDKKGDPIPGANVVVTGTTHGTMTDIAGKYTIDIPMGSTSLTFTFIGMEPQEIVIGTSTQINVIMAEAAIGLNEVIVIGYGTAKKSDLTGSVASIPETRLKELPVTNVLQAVQGAVSGLNIIQTTMVPGGVAYNGATTSVTIRGVNSISANSNPLYVVDGVPLMSGSLNDINPNDIKSIEVLKDVSSVAIYGTRGANGVILITTKRGSDGKPVIRYGAYAGPEMMVNVFKPMNGPEYVRKYVTARLQNGFAVTDSVPTASEKTNYLAGKTTDWIKEISQAGYIQDHNLSLSGGTKGLRYFISGDYLSQRGVLKGYQYKRASLRANIDADVNEWLTVGTSLFFVNNNSGGGRVNLLLATQMSPYGQEYDAMGNYFLIPMTNQTLYPNPLLGLNTTATRENKNMNGNFYAEIKPNFIKGLKFKLNGGYTYNPTFNSSYTGRTANSLIGLATINNTQATNWILENILTYDKTLGKNQINLTGLYSSQENKTLINALNSNTFINDQLDVYNMASGAVQTVSSGYSRNALISQMGRINYSYASKYLLTLTARRDGYSAFGSGTSKYALFPSVALGWNIANEDFMRQLPVIEGLKLRASYGKSGNQAINPYQTLSTQNTVQYVFNGTTATGVIASQLGNSNLTWETSTGINLGLDITLFKGRINGTVEWYKMKTSDILLRRNLPTISGFANILDNIGKTENRGIEFSLKTVNLQIKDFTWETSFNFTANRNKIIELYGDNKDDIGNKWIIGKPLQAVYDYDLIGVWQQGDAALMATMDPGAKVGDMRFRDVNGDNIINEKDRSYLGTSLPKWIGGLSNSFRYKNFRLNIFIQTVQGVLKNNAVLNFADQSLIINLPESVGYWTAENQSNTRPSLRTGTNSRGYGYPSDASYTRIKDVTLSYTLPQVITDRLKIGELSMYISGRNLHTFTKWKGWDPESTFTPGYTVNFDNYPNVATYVFGINLTLR